MTITITMRKHNGIAFLFFVIFSVLNPCHSAAAVQGQRDGNGTVIFGHDAAGNRISRGPLPGSTVLKSRAKSKACNIAAVTRDAVNPDIYIVSLNTSAAFSDYTLTVCDMSGRCFMSRRLSGQVTAVSMAGLLPGTYVVNVSTSEAEYSVKIIKSHR
ncbi:MAG: T9SS type A sorting domain-containing protein [Bacteroidales bacterium]|nr:T9SS type A sorting domain-containing protein [Bacteroidales bacterium]MCM1146364.1 T9SS type A sorting domain-containing protein [Bacteroidales bacterium]MCM1205198.1 T9SS type A sorting domain-containing protein [Bacillota bacterium]MCM1509717.1 T9SS type A sorting domain-containing protein [Clostridium sp.]